MKTRKKIISILTLYSIFNGINAQELKINTGLTISSLKFQEAPSILKNYKSPYISIGIDYIDNKIYYLDSNITFYKKGVNENNIPEKINISNFKYSNFKIDWYFIQLNHLFKMKIPYKKNFFYIGAGPSLDLLLNNSKQTQDLNSYINRMNISIKTELGYKFSLYKKINIGINYSYLFPITVFGRNGDNKIIKSNSSIIAISIGYIL